MEINLRAELEDKLNQIASQSGRTPNHIVEELVETYVDHDQWFKREVQKGLSQLDRDEFIEDDEVMARLDQMFGS